MRRNGQLLKTIVRRGGAPLAVSILLAACATDAIVTVPLNSGSRSVSAMVGQEIEVRLGNVGPAEYESPPQVTSTVIAFLGMDVIPPYTPAGPTQRFRFRAVRAGEAIVYFRRMLGDSVVSVVEDTILVR